MSELIECDYYDCTTKLPEDQMEQFDEYYVCPVCVEKMENASGYCSIGCQLGWGCDDSC